MFGSEFVIDHFVMLYGRAGLKIHRLSFDRPLVVQERGDGRTASFLAFGGKTKKIGEKRKSQ
jgi:hypothetical protein